MAQLEHIAVSLDDFIGIRRPEDHQAWYGPHRDQLLDRLVRWSVLTVAHRIMGEDPDTRKLHDGGKADRWSCIVAEDEERRAERAQLRQYESIHDRRHGVLSDAEVEIPASGSRGFKISRFGKCQERFVRR